jgi:hypothetical protein
MLYKNFFDHHKWWRRREVRWGLRGYHKILRSLDSSISDTHINRCCRCRIHFIASNSNKGRQDLFCPFGCRILRRRELSNKRSREYYQTPEGRKKKQTLNRGRSKSRKLTGGSKHKWSREILLYLHFILKRTEKIHFNLLQLRDMVEEILVRQHSLGRPEG